MRQAAALLLLLAAGAHAQVDEHDHVIVTNRRDMTEEEAETSLQAPSVLIVDSGGALVGRILGSFGRPGHQLGNFTHGHALAVDSKGNLYVAETDAGRRIQKFTQKSL